MGKYRKITFGNTVTLESGIEWGCGDKRGVCLCVWGGGGGVGAGGGGASE